MKLFYIISILFCRVVTVKEDGKDVALYSIHGHPLKSQEFCVSGRDPIVRVYDQRKGSEPLATYCPFKKVFIT